MSAYILADAHIDVLVDAAYQYSQREDRLRWRKPAEAGPGWAPTIVLDDYSKTDLGRMLLLQNARSVATCYNEAQDPSALLYEYRPTNRSFTPGEILMAIKGYEHQACETRDWDESEAHEFCEALRKSVVERTIPHDTDFWSITDEQIGRRTGSAISA